MCDMQTHLRGGKAHTHAETCKRGGGKHAHIQNYKHVGGSASINPCFDNLRRTHQCIHVVFKSGDGGR